MHPRSKVKWEDIQVGKTYRWVDIRKNDYTNLVGLMYIKKKSLIYGEDMYIFKIILTNKPNEYAIGEELNLYNKSYYYLTEI